MFGVFSPFMMDVYPTSRSVALYVYFFSSCELLSLPMCPWGVKLTDVSSGCAPGVNGSKYGYCVSWLSAL